MFAATPEWADQGDALWSAWSKRALAGFANTARLLHGKAPIAPPDGPAHPHERVAEREGVPLLRYTAIGEKRGGVLVVSSLINRFYVLDLLPEISVIDQLCRAGFDVFVLDWQAPGRAGRTRTWADYVDGFLPWAAEQAGGRVNVLGYCMGGTMAAMYAALHNDQVASLILLGAPIDFHRSGILSTFTDERWFDADLIVDAFGNVPPAFLQSAFKLMAAGTLVSKYTDVLQRGGDADALRHFLAVESWLEDNMAFPGGLYREYIRYCYQENRLIQGTLPVGGRTVSLAQIDMPLLNIVALRDNICAPAASLALMDVATSADKTVMEFDTGHIGLTTSKRAMRELWPHVTDWLRTRSPSGS